MGEAKGSSVEEAEKTTDLETIFRKIATAYDHERPEHNDFYRWAREKIVKKPSALVTFAEYVKEMMQSYGV